MEVYTVENMVNCSKDCVSIEEFIKMNDKCFNLDNRVDETYIYYMNNSHRKTNHELKYLCKYCEKEIYVYNMARHINTRKHIRNYNCKVKI